MITYLIGNPGSGKTYYAVYKIYELFLYTPKKSKLSKFINSDDSKDRKFKYKYCYTNINEFKFELSDKFIKFDFERFYDDLTTLYGLYLDKATDDKLNELASELRLNNVVIILDEAHNFLKAKKDDVLIWWLTYHRHLYQDIYLITQDLSLINSEYKRIAEYFYKAADSSKRLFKNKLRYVLYGSYKMYKKDEYSRLNIPFIPEVFNLYHSGSTDSSSSLIRKFFLIAFLIGLLFIFVFYILTSGITAKGHSDINRTAHSKQTISQSSKDSSTDIFNSINSNKSTSRNAKVNSSNKDINSLNLFIYDISCFNQRCSIKGYKIVFPESFLDYLISSHNPLYYMPYNEGSFNNYFLVFDSAILENLKSINNKGVTDEKTTTSFNPTSSFFK